MKRIALLAIVACLAVGSTTLAVNGLVPEDATCVPLLAGQDIEVGEVCIWKDADSLCVKYTLSSDAIDDGWLIYQTHWAVAEEAAGIPQKNGNPIPGQFPYGDGDLGGVESYGPECVLFEELGVSACDLIVAAHAVIRTVASDEIQLVSTDAEGAGIMVYGPVDTYAAPWDESWGTEQTPVAVSKNSAWAPVSGAAWITSPSPVNADLSSWQWFSHQFILPDTAFNIDGGDLTVNSDNAERVWMNSTWIGEVGKIVGTVETGDRGKHTTTTDYAVVPSVTPGMNVLDIIVRNYNPVNPPAENPTALAYNGTITYDYFDKGATAWGGGPEFDGKNWATYIPYAIQCPEPLVVNGGFEYPLAPTTVPTWGIWPSGTEGLGWTVEWYDGSTSYGGQTRPEPALLELHRSGTLTGVNADEGDQYAELDTDWDGPGGGLNNEPASVRIYQDICTCPGQEYTLSYSWMTRPDRVCQVEVYWDGGFVTQLINSSDWVEATHTVSGSITDYSTRLEFIETGTPDSFGMFLDNVSLVPTD